MICGTSCEDSLVSCDNGNRGSGFSVLHKGVKVQCFILVIGLMSSPGLGGRVGEGGRDGGGGEGW